MTVDEKLDLILQEISGMKQEISGVKMTIENVTNKNIKIIAESHIDLNRKLNEVIHTTSDIRAYHEMQSILVNEHTDKLKKII